MSEKYDYYKVIAKDIFFYIKDNGLFPKQNESMSQYIDRLSDELWDEDSITGNGGLFYDTEDNCLDYVAHNLDLYFQAATDWDSFPKAHDEWIYVNPGQYMDCTIRCYLLEQCIAQVVNENWKDWRFIEDDNQIFFIYSLDRE